MPRLAKFVPRRNVSRFGERQLAHFVNAWQEEASNFRRNQLNSLDLVSSITGGKKLRRSQDNIYAQTFPHMATLFITPAARNMAMN